MSVGLSVRRKIRSYSYSKEPLYTQMSVGRSVRKKHSRYAEKAYVNNQSNSLQPLSIYYFRAKKSHSFGTKRGQILTKKSIRGPKSHLG